MIYHGDVFEKVLVVLVFSGMLVMGISSTHAFDTDQLTNTGLIFIFGHLFSRCVLVLSNLSNAYFIPIIRPAMIFVNTMDLFLMCLYFPLYAVPTNGDERNEKLKYILWGIASVIVIFSPLLHHIPVTLSLSNVQNDSLVVNIERNSRMVVNIEHYRERFELLVILGTVVLNNISFG
jgi:hypothetical protein